MTSRTLSGLRGVTELHTKKIALTFPKSPSNLPLRPRQFGADNCCKSHQTYKFP